MRIACVAYLDGTGGAEKQIIMLSNAMAMRKHEVHLIVLANNNRKYDINDKVIIHDLASLEKLGRSSVLQRYLLLSRALKKIQPDISVHFWLQSAYLCFAMPIKITGKVIYAERGDPGDSEYDGLLGVVRNLAFKRVAGFVFQLEGARDYFKKKIRNKSVIIHNSIPIPDGCFLKPCSCRENKIVNVGRLHEQKNQSLLIEAFRIVADRIPDVSLEIFGDGSLKESLQKQIDALNLHDRVSLRGTTKNILDELYSAKVFVLSSDYEGMPNALMEAMAIGVPVVSTDCRPGGARALIKNNENGWLTSIGNTNELAEKILWVLMHKTEAENVAQKGMEIRNSHAQTEIYDQWEHYFETLV